MTKIHGLSFILIVFLFGLLYQSQNAFSQRLQLRRDMLFGDVEFSTVHKGRIRLTPSGALKLTNSPSGLVLTGTGQSGRVRVRERTGVIEIRCSNTATLADSSGNTIPISEVRVSFPTAKGWGNALTRVCNGVGGAAVDIYDLTADPANNLNIYVGGKINVNGSAIQSSDTYSTANAGGVAVTIDVVFQ